MGRVENPNPIQQYNFTPALDRPYIPRDGFYPGAKYQLSVAPHPKLFVPTLETIGEKDIQTLWKEILDDRVQSHNSARMELHISNKIPIVSDYDVLEPLAFGPTTEQLFKSHVVPTIKKHCDETKKTQVAIDDVSYLLPLWNKKELEPVQIIEGELSRLIKEGGKLPPNVGAVFLDFPPNQQKKDVQYNISELIEFMKDHPDVLFIIDQANLHFSAHSINLNDDLMFDELILSNTHDNRKNRLGDSLVLVTNTTTKAFGISGCAVASGTNRVRKLLKQELGQPAMLFNNQEQVNDARKSLYLETPKAFNFNSEQFLKLDAANAFTFRMRNFEYKKKLQLHLQKLFGGSVNCPELDVEGARILINAQELGFRTAQDLCDTLYRDFFIATKPATVYASPKKQKEWSKYIQMTVPWNEEIMNAVSNAFEKIYQVKKTKLKLLGLIRKLKK